MTIASALLLAVGVHLALRAAAPTSPIEIRDAQNDSARAQRIGSPDPAPQFGALNRGVVLVSRPVPARLPAADHDEQWRRFQPISDLLPHFPPEDIYKLRYYCLADFDKNDEINADDLLMFLDAFADPSHPLSDWTDINADGMIDQQDLIEFIRAFESPCDPSERRQARSEIC